MIPFKNACLISVSRQTGSGKSEFIRRLLKHKEEMFSPAPDKILYCYGVYQPLFDKMQTEMPYEFLWFTQ